ncbi:MAG: hypothetical protein M3083_04540 [Actinomycetota bacterium]|nr:hypothetical protein [Actinomycetota bacterium]
MRASSPREDATRDLRPLLLELGAAIDGLPNRIAKAASAAMRQQHDTNRRDLADLWRQMVIEADLIQGMQRREAAPDHDAIMSAVDDRFQWLVDELSERFVVFGNELVRIERRLAAHNNSTATHGHGEGSHDLKS